MKRSNRNAVSNKENLRKMIGCDTPFTVKEAYNAIRTKLMFSSQGEKCPIYVITSPLSGDGKTINVINLAICFSQTGKRTLIIDADMRKPSVNKYFKLSRENGLSEYLAGITDQVHIHSTETDNLYVLTSGNIPPNPSELLGTHKMDFLISFVSANFDYVFIDTPPVNVVTDATVFASKVTCYVLVIRNGDADLETVSSAVVTLQQLGAKIAGFALNDISGKGTGYYGKNNYSAKYDRYKYGYAVAGK